MSILTLIMPSKRAARREWRFRQMVLAERKHQIEDRGYDAQHDDLAGEDHLLHWAGVYAAQGRAVESAAIIEAIRDLRRRERQRDPLSTPLRLPYDEKTKSWPGDPRMGVRVRSIYGGGHEVIVEATDLFDALKKAAKIDFKTWMGMD